MNLDPKTPVPEQERSTPPNGPDIEEAQKEAAEEREEEGGYQ